MRAGSLLCRSSFRLLIKKGIGTWPVDALATIPVQTGTGANSIRRKAGR